MSLCKRILIPETELLEVGAQFAQLCDVRNLHAINALHHHYIHPAQVPVDRGHMNDGRAEELPAQLRGIAVRQGLRFLRAELPGLLAMRGDVLSPHMVRLIEDLTGDWRRLDERIEAYEKE